MTYDRVQMNIDRWVERQTAKQALAIVELYTLADPTAEALLRMHAPVEHDWDSDICAGCPDGDEGWPCLTVLQIAQVHGIDYPTGGWADDPEFDRFAPIPGYPTDIEDPSITEKETTDA